MGDLWNLVRSWRAPTLDPMRTLELQLRLTRLAGEIRRCRTAAGFAVAHHTRAAESAYETTLRHSLRHIGADDSPYPPGEVVSLELELSARGWHW